MSGNGKDKSERLHFSPDSEPVELQRPPPDVELAKLPAGFFIIGGSLGLPCNEKPNWLRIKMHKLILGWEWQDIHKEF